LNKFQKPMQPYPGLERWSSELHLPIQQVNLFFYDTGEAAQMPVLLIHGLGDEADTWRHVLPSICLTHRVIAPDLPGFGRSDKAKRKYTIPFFIDTMLELMDRLSISQAILIGHSTGAIIAHALAVQQPERVKRLVLISGSLVSKENQINSGLLFFLTPWLGERIYTRLRKDSEKAYLSLEPYYNHLENLSQADRDFLYQRVNERVWSNGQRMGFLSTFRNLVAWLPSQQKSLPARLSGWKIPTTVIWGENDRINSINNAHALVKIMPSTRLVTVPGAGHNLHQENAGVLVAEIT